MRINVKATINDYDDIPMPKDKDDESKGFQMLGNMMITALNAQFKSEVNLTADKKIHRGFLSQDIHNAMKEKADGNVDLPSEDITEIKDVLGKLYPPLSLMKAYGLIDPYVIVRHQQHRYDHLPANL